MKSGIILLGQVFAASVIFTSASSALAQTPVTVLTLGGNIAGPPALTRFEFTNVAGITYFKYELSGSGTLTVGSVVNNAHVTHQSFLLTSPEVSIPEPVVNLFQGVSVLGALPAGTNYFTLNLPAQDSGEYDPNSPWIEFVIPTNTPPALTSVSVDNDLFHFTVNGVTGVRYTVQTSDNLTNWTSIATNSGAPFMFTEPRDLSITNRFYRTIIEAEAVKVN